MKYIDWIKTLACSVCADDTKTDPHHLIADGQGIMGGKSPDSLLMPLCRKHHDELHDDVLFWEISYGRQEVHICKAHRLAAYQGWRMEQKS
jgi:hypothetical protein